MKKHRYVKIHLLLLLVLLIVSGCEKQPPADSTILSEPSLDNSVVSLEPSLDYSSISSESILDYSSISSEKILDYSTDAVSEDMKIDLTLLSSTAVYGQVFDMMYYPEKYIGKTVRMKGLYSDYCDESTGKHYFACIIMDATACCSQGIEFILTDDYKYPEDYPAEDDEITVEGIFDVYTEESGSYCTLRLASLL